MSLAAEVESRSGIQVLTRAVDIIRLLDVYPAGLTQSEIAEELRLARSTASRLLVALEAEGFVATRGVRGRYRLGPEFVRLAASARRQSWLDLHPLLVELSSEIGETVDVSVLDGNRATFVDQVVSANRLQAVSAVGDVFPLHASANGKAFLAALPEAECRRVLSGRLEAFTPNTLTTPDAVRAELGRIRDRGGVALDREEHSLGVCAVGAVIGHLDHDLLAVSIPVPAARFEGREGELTEAVEDFAVRIAETIAERA